MMKKKGTRMVKKQKRNTKNTNKKYVIKLLFLSLLLQDNNLAFMMKERMCKEEKRGTSKVMDLIELYLILENMVKS